MCAAVRRKFRADTQDHDFIFVGGRYKYFTKIITKSVVQRERFLVGLFPALAVIIAPVHFRPVDLIGGRSGTFFVQVSIQCCGLYLVCLYLFLQCGGGLRALQSVDAQEPVELCITEFGIPPW